MLNSRLWTRLLFLLPLTVFLGACQPDDDDNDEPAGSSLEFGEEPTPGDGQGFEPAETAEEQSELLNEIWSSLNAPACWDATYVGSHVGNVSQYQFYGNFEYRHFGFNINFGAMTWIDVGHYQGYPTALVTTWTGDIEMLVLTDETELVHVFWHTNGAPVPLVYRTTAGPCL